MKIKTHTIKNTKIAEIISTELVINSTEDSLNLLGDLYYQGFDSIIIYEKNITSDFFDLKNGMAGEILQKFSNYRMKLTIIGDFEKYRNERIQEFIYESNKVGHISFVKSISDALVRFSRKYS